MKKARAVEVIKAKMDLESKMYTDPNTNSQQKASAMERFSVYVGLLPLIEDIEPFSEEATKS